MSVELSLILICMQLKLELRTVFDIKAQVAFDVRLNKQAFTHLSICCEFVCREPFVIKPLRFSVVRGNEIILYRDVVEHQVAGAAVHFSVQKWPPQ